LKTVSQMSNTNGALALKPRSPSATEAGEAFNGETLTAGQVAGYLRDHPEFFLEHEDLVADLTLPGPPAEVASLPHRQLAIWRQRHKRLDGRLAQIIRTAEENARHDARMHQLVLRWLPSVHNADSVPNFLSLLSTLFAVDVARFVDWDRLDETRRTPFRALLESNFPSCGRITEAQRTILFDDALPQTGSAAIIPVRQENGRILGLLGLGRNAPEGFRPDQGTVFLHQLGEMLAAGLPSHS